MNGWTVTAHENEQESWLVLTGPQGQGCAFSAERGSVRAQVIQDFIVSQHTSQPATELAASDASEWPPIDEHMAQIDRVSAQLKAAQPTCRHQWLQPDNGCIECAVCGATRNHIRRG